MGKLYPRHEKQTKNPAETTGNRYKIEILMSRTQKFEGIVCCFAQIENIKRQSLVSILYGIEQEVKIDEGGNNVLINSTGSKFEYDGNNISPLFFTEEYKHVSAVLFSSCGTFRSRLKEISPGCPS